VLEKDLETTKKKLEQLLKAKSATEQLEKNVGEVKDGAQAKAKERAVLEKSKTKLEDDLRDLKKKLKDQIDSRNILSDLLEKKKLWLKRKLQSRIGIEEFLLEMNADIDGLKRALQQEKVFREQFEVHLEVEMADINRRLLIDMNLVEKRHKQLEEAVRIRQAVVHDVDLLKQQFLLLADKLSGGGKSDKVDSSKEEIPRLMDDIEAELSAMNDLLDVGIAGPDQINRNFHELKVALDNEVKARERAEATSKSLEQKLGTLESQLHEERAARKSLEERVESLFSKK